jgi:hypothetical protein
MCLLTMSSLPSTYPLDDMMKKCLSLLLAASTLWGCANPSPPPAPMGSLAAMTLSPKLMAGQQWNYKRMDLWKNEEAERFSQTLMEDANGKWRVYWTILSSIDGTRIGTTPEQFDAATHGFADPLLKGQHQPLKFPLSIGKSWTFSYQYQSKADTLVDVTQTAQVMQWETVTVPAGTFKALRVEHAGRYTATKDNQSWRGRITETYWYAPDAGRVVAQEYKDTTGTGKTWDQRRDELVAMRL